MLPVNDLFTHLPNLLLIDRLPQFTVYIQISTNVCGVYVCVFLNCTRYTIASFIKWTSPVRAVEPPRPRCEYYVQSPINAHFRLRSVRQLPIPKEPTRINQSICWLSWNIMYYRIIVEGRFVVRFSLYLRCLGWTCLAFLYIFYKIV